MESRLCCKSMLGIFLLGPKQVFFRLFSPFFGYIVTAMLPQKRKNSRKNPLFLAPAENPQHALKAWPKADSVSQIDFEADIAQFEASFIKPAPRVEKQGIAQTGLVKMRRTTAPAGERGGVKVGEQWGEIGFPVLAGVVYVIVTHFVVRLQSAKNAHWKQ